MPKNNQKISTFSGDYKFGFKTETSHIYKAPKGLTEETVREISKQKNEPNWMLDFRLNAYKIFKEKPLETWGADLSEIDFDNLHFYIRPQDKPKTNWNDVPEEIKDTFEKLGVPQSERKFLAGTGAQFESEVVYHSLHKSLKDQGVIFESTDIALQKYPELFKEHFSKIIPPSDNKFAALNSAVWSGGSFIYIPKNVHVALPLQSYFRINAENMGQFERTLIIADEGSSIHYLEGCTAPTYSSDSLHAAVVEIIVKKDAKVQYTTVQNWSNNIYNLVTKRAHAYENAQMFWLDCNLGSKITMKYPAIYLMGKSAKGQVQSLAVAGENQHLDAGAKIIHAAANTSSNILSKSISLRGGNSTYRGLVKVNKSAKNSKNKVVCDALILDATSRSDTYPIIESKANDTSIEHEATVSKIGDDQLFYLMSRGLSEQEANSLIVNGFATPIIDQLPTDYAIELTRLLEMEMGNN